MFERFTDEGRSVMAVANEQAHIGHRPRGLFRWVEFSAECGISNLGFLGKYS